MDLKLYTICYSKFDENDNATLPVKCMYALCRSRGELRRVFQSVIDKYDLGFSYRIESEQPVAESIFIMGGENPPAKSITEKLAFGTIDEDSLNHFVFGNSPILFDRMNGLISSPPGYINNAIEWFKRNEYYEINAKLKKYENFTRRLSLPEGRQKGTRT